MEYNDIIKLEDIEERTEKLRDFYNNTISVNDWLNNDTEQVIKFVDRVEYKTNNIYHRLDGPAIEYYNYNTTSHFFIDGVEMDESEWEPVAKNILREKKLNRALKNKKT